jgi:hypothetical protein
MDAFIVLIVVSSAVLAREMILMWFGWGKWRW